MSKAKKKAGVSMIRDKFFDGERPAVHMGVPRLKVQKGVKMITLSFSVEMKPAYVKACDPKIVRAFDDCADLSREIDQVILRVRVPNTDIEFFDVLDNADNFYQLSSVELDSFVMQRAGHDIYMSFQAKLQLLRHENLGRFALERYAHTLWAEFKPSQFALNDGFAQAAANLAAPVANGSIESLTISMKGGPSVTIDKAAAQQIQKNAGRETQI